MNDEPTWQIPEGFSWKPMIETMFCKAEHREILMIKKGDYVWWKKRWRRVRHVVWAHPISSDLITVSFVGASSQAVGHRPNDTMLVYTGMQGKPIHRPSPNLTGDLV